VYFLDCIVCASLRSVTIGFGFQIRFEDRLQHQLRGSLHRSIPDSGNSERALTASGFINHHPAHWLWFVRLVA
jgi:hypothetical protein